MANKNKNKLTRLRVMSFVVLGILISGCSSSPHTTYQQLAKARPNTTFQSPLDAVNNAPNETLHLGQLQSAKIRITNPVMELDDTLSNFVVYKTEKLSRGSYSLDIVGNCYECIGLSKNTILPYIQLFNSNKMKTPSFNKESETLPGFLLTKYFDVIQPDSYLILVAADNRSLGNSLVIFPNSANYNGQRTISLPVSVNVNPEGNVSLHLKKIE